MDRTSETSTPQAVSRTQLLAAGAMTLIVLRFFSGALPLAHDEAYYWLWSSHLAWGYYDHPPAVAFLIRLGTDLFGSTEFGIRVVSLVLMIPTTLCVARAAEIVIGSREDGARAALFFNVTLMVNGHVIMQSPDAPVLFCNAIYLWALLELVVTQKFYWWLIAGFVAGLGLLSKYTMFMTGLGTLVWLVWSNDARPWLRTPWPWAGGCLALLIVLPNLLWNASHDWSTFVFQFGRLSNDLCSGRACSVPGLELLNLTASQIGLLSPLLFILAAVGVWRSVRTKDSARRLIAALIVPNVIIFSVHTFTAHVHDNWPSFLYPALAVAAADGFRNGSLPRVLNRATLPLALVMLAAAYVQAGVALSGFAGRNFMGGYIAFNMSKVSAAVGDEVAKTNARAILTLSYSATAWLRFYSPAAIPVIQIDDFLRYPDEPTPTLQDLSGPLLLVYSGSGPTPDLMQKLRSDFSVVEPEDSLVRPGSRDVFKVYRLDGFHGAPFGRIPYPPNT